MNFQHKSRLGSKNVGAGSKRLRTRRQPVLPQRMPKLGAGRAVSVGLVFAHLL